MKVFHLSILEAETLPDGKLKGSLLFYQSDVSSFGYFERTTNDEFMRLAANLAAERAEPGRWSYAQEQLQKTTHILTKPTSGGFRLSAVAIADTEYPETAAFAILGELMDRFQAAFPKNGFSYKPAVETKFKLRQQAPSTNATTVFPALVELFDKANDGKSLDSLTKVQLELDATQQVLKSTMEKLLRRGENLDQLVEQSGHLSTQSRLFYQATKRTGCCPDIW